MDGSHLLELNRYSTHNQNRRSPDQRPHIRPPPWSTDRVLSSSSRQPETVAPWLNVESSTLGTITSIGAIPRGGLRRRSLGAADFAATTDDGGAPCAQARSARWSTDDGQERVATLVYICLDMIWRMTGLAEIPTAVTGSVYNGCADSMHRPNPPWARRMDLLAWAQKISDAARASATRWNRWVSYGLNELAAS